MAKAIRITPEETFAKMRAGKALLVCAYDSEEQFRSMQLEGAISLPEFKAKLSALSKDQEIVFYCA
jgi:rhodanese-related sulfurtransferase